MVQSRVSTKILVEDKNNLTSQLQPWSDSLVEESIEIQLQRMLAFAISLIISPNTDSWGKLLQKL